MYNHTLFPIRFADEEAEYWHLVNHVTLWDVSVERQVEITGPDAFRFVNRLTPRDLTRCAVGQGKYVVITADDGGIINDPVLLRLGENHFWLALADSDVLLWARGVALDSGLRVEIHEPDVSPLQVQGPKAGEVVRELFGDRVLGLKYYHFIETTLDEIPVVVTRTGWTGEVGYEIYLRDGSRGDELWERIMAAGRPYDIRPTGPSDIRRIEAGILNWGDSKEMLRLLTEEIGARLLGADLRRLRICVDSINPEVYPLNTSMVSGWISEHHMAIEHGRELARIQAAENLEETSKLPPTRDGSTRVVSSRK